MEYRAYSFPEFPFDMLIIYHISITKQNYEGSPAHTVFSTDCAGPQKSLRFRGRDQVGILNLYDLT